MSKKIDENGNEVVVDDGVVDDGVDGEVDKKADGELVDESGVLWKNRAKEYERKYNDELKKHTVPDKKPDPVPAVKTDRIAKFREGLERKGYSRDEIDEKVEAMQTSVDIARDDREESMKAFTQPLNSVKETVNYNHRMALLNKFEENADIGGYVKKYKKDIEAELDNIPLDYALPPETMEAVIGRVLLNKKAFAVSPSSGKKLKEDEIISDLGDSSVKGKIDNVDIDELREFALQNDYGIKTPEQQKSVVKAFKLRQKVLDREKGKVAV